jgi:hypothetical protein
MILEHLATLAYYDFVEQDGFQIGLAIVVRIIVGFGGSRRGINSPSESAPASLLSPQREVERMLNDTTERAGRRGAKLSLPVVAEVANTSCAMPAAVLVPFRTTIIASKLTACLHASPGKRSTLEVDIREEDFVLVCVVGS